MYKIKITIILISLVIISCGKSEKDKELEKTKIELQKVKNQLETERLQKDIEEKKLQNEKVKKNIELQKTIEKKKLENERLKKERINRIKKQKLINDFEKKSLVGKKKIESLLNNELDDAKFLLKKNYKQLEIINEFKLGRLLSEKQQQIKDKNKEISDIKKYIKRVQNEISQLEYRKSFAFQENPESVLKFIFEYSKNGETSKFRYLCDPYAENNPSVNMLCFIETLSEKDRIILLNEFKNGRIMGNPKNEKNIAIIEFAYGLNSSQLGKIELIKRLNKWYLLNFNK